MSEMKTTEDRLGYDPSGAIIVWHFDEAPEELRDLSDHGGDEDWLALMPAIYKDSTPPWIEMGSFGLCDVSYHDLPDGRIVAIGAHA